MAFDSLLFSANYTRFAKDVKRLLDTTAPYDAFVKLDSEGDNNLALAELLYAEDALGSRFEDELCTLVNTCTEHLLAKKRQNHYEVLRSFDEEIKAWETLLSQKGYSLSAGVLNDCRKAIRVNIVFNQIERTKPESLLHNNGTPYEVEAWIRLRKRMQVAWSCREADLVRHTKYMMTKVPEKDLAHLLTLKIIPKTLNYLLDKETAPMERSLGAKRISFRFPSTPNARVLSLMDFAPSFFDGNLSFDLLRTSGELSIRGHYFLSARQFFKNAGIEFVYEYLRAYSIVTTYNFACLDEYTTIIPWMSQEDLREEDQIDEELPEELPVETPEVWEDITAPQAPEKENEPSVVDIIAPKNRDLLRQNISLARVLTVLKANYGIRVEWSDHPMLCRDGKRVRYPNPHDTDKKRNARHVRQALRAFGIPREEFYKLL